MNRLEQKQAYTKDSNPKMLREETIGETQPTGVKKSDTDLTDFYK